MVDKSPFGFTYTDIVKALLAVKIVQTEMELLIESEMKLLEEREQKERVGVS